MRHGWRVPLTYVLPYAVSTAYRRDAKTLLAGIEKKIQKLLKQNQSYAIRSSANLEDLDQHSYAGQFQSFLNVCGIDQILFSIQNVLEAAHSPTVLSYAKKMGQDMNELSLAVIIQEMVPPVTLGCLI